MLTGQILLQLIVILLGVQICGFLCKCVGQQWVIGEILAGLALGPSLLGALLPGLKAALFPASAFPTLQTIGDLGLVLYMFSLGARLDIHLLLHQGRTAVITSLCGILCTLIPGALAASLLFPALAGAQASRISFMLLVGTAMAITAFPVLSRLLSEKRLLQTRIGTLALTAAAVGDVLAWCLLALVIAVAHAQGLVPVGITVGLTMLFVVVMLAVVRPLLAGAQRRLRSQHALSALAITLLLLSAYTTNALGIHPVFGAFLMGLALPRTVLFVRLVREIDRVNGALFLPLYFVYSGLRTQIGLIGTPWLWLVCLGALVIACGGKMLGSIVPMRLLGEKWHDAFSLGVLMNTRGLVELIVLNIGLDLGVL
ncbi:MAG TPA: cation:proton antiporter, partial [Ktedonobacteraceae bacterium]